MKALLTIAVNYTSVLHLLKLSKVPIQDLCYLTHTVRAASKAGVGDHNEKLPKSIFTHHDSHKSYLVCLGIVRNKWVD